MDQKQVGAPSLDIEPLCHADGQHRFGVEIRGVDIRDADADVLNAIADLWSRQPLVLLRDQLPSEAELMRFSRTFGELEVVVRKDIHSPYHPEVAFVSNLYLENGTNIGGLGNYELRWHTDQSYRERPATGAVFHAIEVPPRGGDTRWINTVLAWQALDEPTRRLLDGRTGSFAYAMYDTDITEDPEVKSIRRRTPDASHPLVLTHPISGERSLYFDPTQTFAIEGLAPDESDALVERLREHVLQPQFQQVHHWRMGDVMLWDNARLLHSRDAFDNRLPRLAKRTTVFLRPDLFPLPA
jgi:taurine dioxygenase